MRKFTATRLCLASSVALAVAAGCAGEPDPKPKGPTDDPPPADPECVAHADCSDALPFCEPDAGVCAEQPAGWELGWGDGSPTSVTLTTILQDGSMRRPVDLAFNPAIPTELWVVNQQDDSVVIIQEPGAPSMSFLRKKDPAAGHFMNAPPALAMGSVDETWGQTFGTCGDHDNVDGFIGPALFATGSDVFAVQTPGGLGSHLDMLHSTRYCRGIAHVSGNAYFVFNADRGALDRYDFGGDHDPGNDDHSDGVILRYVDGMVTGVEGVPSHLVYEGGTNLLYVADTGTGRVLVLDAASGTPGNAFGGMEQVEERRRVDGATLLELLPAGTLGLPSGIELHRDLVFVSDHAASAFYAFAKDGSVVNALLTGLPAGSLAGLTLGPDGKVYFVDMLGGRVMRIDPIAID